MRDYFSENPTYGPKHFRRRFRMHQSAFEKLMLVVSEFDSFFLQKRDCTGKLGLSTLQKCTAAMRILCYGFCADSVDEYCRMSESTALKTLKRFCKAVVDSDFGKIYLREPNEDDIRRILIFNETRGFKGLFGSLDCMHWEWKNCPKAWHGQYKGKRDAPTVVLEAVASYDLWIWHHFFGTPGSCNDVNILDRSTILQKLISISCDEYIINNCARTKPYFLVDGIYPELSRFVKSFSQPVGEKAVYFTQKQESCRKDVERAFGVLQSRFAILTNPSKLWYQKDMNYIIKCCICLHNYIIEDEGVSISESSFCSDSRNMSSRNDSSLHWLRVGISELYDSEEFKSLQVDVMEHLWKWRGDQ